MENHLFTEYQSSARQAECSHQYLRAVEYWRLAIVQAGADTSRAMYASQKLSEALDLAGCHAPRFDEAAFSLGTKAPCHGPKTSLWGRFRSLLRMAAVVTLAMLPHPVSRLGPPAVCHVRAAIVERIARAEGFHVPGTLPARLHNPGALRYRGQPGARLGRLLFANFESDAAGWAALERDVSSKLRRHIPLHIAWAYIK